MKRDRAPAPTGDAVAPFSELSARRLGPIRRYFLRHPVAMDALVVAIFVFFWMVTATLIPPGPDNQVTVWLVGSVAASVVLFWRRRAPLVVLGVLILFIVVTVALTGGTAAYELGVGFAVYAVAASRPPGVAWAALLATLAATAAALYGLGPSTVATVGAAGQTVQMDTRPDAIIGYTFTTLIALAIGTSVRNRRLHIADLVDRANALARDREQQAELARAAERSLISREMHDVVAHSLSVMIALADGAGVALERAPDKARLALAELSDTGRTALADMRRVLGVLERDDAPLEPQPKHTDLAALVERFRTAGLAVRTQGLEAELPGDATVQLAVYRIVQESLTNALRHAPGATVVLTVTATERVVTVEVTSHGGLRTTESPGAGRGLIGMRERAAVYGGTVEAGPWQEDGWRVHATLPWRKDEG